MFWFIVAMVILVSLIFGIIGYIVCNFDEVWMGRRPL